MHPIMKKCVFKNLKDGFKFLSSTFNRKNSVYTTRQKNKICEELDYIQFLFTKYIDECRYTLTQKVDLNGKS